MSQVINIFPIFDQGPEVWSDFAKIQDIFEVRMMYGPTYLYSRNYACHELNLAFGAYKKNEMVGYCMAHKSGDKMVLSDLYVLSEWRETQNYVGSRLLAAAENTAALHAKKVFLSSTESAQRFYKKYEYKQVKPPLNHFSKTLAPADGVVPVFHIDAQLSAAFTQIISQFFKSRGRLLGPVEEQAIFAHATNGKINGFIVGSASEEEEEDDFVIKKLFVAKEMHKRGIGRQLVGAMENFARHSGSKLISLAAFEQASRFYRKLGYFGECNHMFKKL